MGEREQGETGAGEHAASRLLLRRTKILPLSLAGALFVTALVWISGGPSSPLLFLYLPLVMLPSISVTPMLGIQLSFLYSALYSALSWSLVHGIIPLGDGSERVILPHGGLILQIIGLTSGMVLVSVLTSYLMKRIRHSIAEIEQSHRDLSVLSAKQASVINEFPHAVVVAGLDGIISDLNQAAADLLRVGTEQARGAHVSGVLSAVADKEILTTLNGSDDERACEVDVAGAEDSQSRKLRIMARPVIDVAGKCSGRLYFIQDITRLHTAEEQLALQERMARLLADQDMPLKGVCPRLEQFVGESVVMQKMFRIIERVAPSEATVLICGESGTGKELVAKALHLGSSRSGGPFVPVNCGAIPENLIESELFGHRKGSFTGADSDYTGLFRQADNGTIFLDEIGELPLSMQAKLLRAIQEKSVRPVGSNRDLPINVRILAATNRNLKREVQEGRFREDLFYRLNVININLPPLRERKDDIPFLVNSILKRLVSKERTPVIPPATMQFLLTYDYPGNVRELENILERAVVLGGEVILPEHLPDSLRNVNTPVAASTQIIVDEEIAFPVKLDELLANIERRYLVTALTKTNGAKKKAADLLGVNFRSFRYRLEKFGLNDD